MFTWGKRWTLTETGFDAIQVRRALIECRSGFQSGQRGEPARAAPIPVRPTAVRIDGGLLRNGRPQPYVASNLDAVESGLDDPDHGEGLSIHNRDAAVERR